MKGKNLVNLLKNGGTDYIIENVEESDYRSALHDFFLEKDYEGLSNLISSLAEFYVREGLAERKDYNLLLKKARKDVKTYAESADDLFGTNTTIFNFYKKSLDRNVVNEFLDKNNLTEPAEFFIENPEYNL